MAVQLFKLPEYERVFTRFAHEAVNELMAQKDPVLGRLKTVKSKQLPTIQNTMPSGETVRAHPVEVTLPFKFNGEDVISGALDQFACAIEHTAGEALKQIMPQLFERLGKLSEAAGTAVNAGGQPLSHELILDMIRRVDIAFDEAGNPVLPTMGMGPAMYEAWQKLPPPTEEQERAFRETIEEKKREYNARRRYRKLF